MMKQKSGKQPLFALKYLAYDFIKVTAALPGLIWLRPRWIYAAPEAREYLRGGALVIANHVGFLDPVYLMYAIWYRRHRFVCGKEFFESKARWFFRAFRCIPIDRENFGLDSLRLIADELRAGSVVTMFPEGHISAEGGEEIAAFKPGMVLMALQGRAPVVPVYFQPRKHWYSRLRVVIGQKLDIIETYGTHPTMSQIDEIVTLLRGRVEELKAIAEERES